MVCRKIIKKSYAFWRTFSKLLEKVNATILLTAIFYLVVTPTAFIYRVFNSKTLNHFFKKKKSSYFADCNQNIYGENFEKLW